MTQSIIVADNRDRKRNTKQITGGHINRDDLTL